MVGTGGKTARPSGQGPILGSRARPGVTPCARL